VARTWISLIRAIAPLLLFHFFLRPDFYWFTSKMAPPFREWFPD